MELFGKQPAATSEDLLDPLFREQVDRLHRVTVYARWIFAGILWLTVGSISLWGLRYPISLLREYFTWSAVRYGLVFNPYPAFGLFLCLGVTLGILVWQIRNWLFGLPKRERKRLEQAVLRIRQQGPSHPLWKFVQSNHS
ncbi:hypothetical protein [Leptodesmis sp.]|uniref:hypothetical protein n=1 Tax=Leptodesmis sp. TaxID=3100501 RepID=UPI0040534CB4